MYTCVTILTIKIMSVSITPKKSLGAFLIPPHPLLPWATLVSKLTRFLKGRGGLGGKGKQGEETWPFFCFPIIEGLLEAETYLAKTDFS